eukprot:c44737_g1_i1 orf=379-582(+)
MESDLGFKAYHLYNPQTCKFIFSRNVIFWKDDLLSLQKTATQSKETQSKDNDDTYEDSMQLSQHDYE